MVLKFLPKMKVFYPWKRNLHNPDDARDDVDHHRVHFVLHRAWQVVRWGIKTQPVELTSEKADKNRGKMRGKEVKRRSKSSYAPEWTNNVLTNHTQPQKGILNIKSQYIMLNVYFIHIAEIKKCCSLRICTEYWNGKRVGPPWPPTIRETRLGVTLRFSIHNPFCICNYHLPQIHLNRPSHYEEILWSFCPPKVSRYYHSRLSRVLTSLDRCMGWYRTTLVKQELSISLVIIYYSMCLTHKLL